MQFWLLTVLSSAVLVLAVANYFLVGSNRSLQREVNSRQRYIAQTSRIDRLNREMIQALANISAKSGDSQIRKMLAVQGITFTTNSRKTSIANVHSAPSRSKKEARHGSHSEKSAKSAANE
jgi:predicted Holliday junction resolvase-like endonuclease